MDTEEADYILEIVSDYSEPEFGWGNCLNFDETLEINGMVYEFKDFALKNEQGEMSYTLERIAEKIDEFLMQRIRKTAAAIAADLYDEFRDLFFRKKAGEEIPHRQQVLSLFFEPIKATRPQYTQAQVDEQVGRSMYHIIRKLQKEGYIEREDTGKTKGPRYLYRLTPEGWDAIDKHGVAGAEKPLTPTAPTREAIVKI